MRKKTTKVKPSQPKKTAQKKKPVAKKLLQVEAASATFVPDFNENDYYYHILNQVIDPETGIGIADMGLIYHVEEKKGIIDVTMTLTSMGCPAGPDLVTNIDGVLRLEKGIKDVLIAVVWEPMWTPDKMKSEIREMMFGSSM